MGKVKYFEISEQERKDLLNDFYGMVALLDGKDDVANFFKDLLTPSEAIMISRRIRIAKMLMKGNTYAEIQDKLGVGVSTIIQVDKWLNQGFGGYRNVIKKYDKKKKKGDRVTINEGVLPFSLDHLRKKYPAHFLLINILKGE